MFYFYFRYHGLAAVFGPKLFQLPLPGQHPSSIPDFGAKTAVEFGAARPAFEAITGDEGGYSPNGAGG
ncbi:hypothetical protein GCM10023185_33270 [Hymenobacter saemangeumensis]|uniref:Uncharacterized protein n=1 Tax=Hymenobacter saemangeumensis TaxID=1084522 RepID=A0ABP8IP72_9BACT